MVDTKKILSSLALVAIVGSTQAQTGSKNANPGSLWKNGGSDILADRLARKAGDVITIIISETSSASYKAETKADKNDSTSINKGIGPILANLIPKLEIGANSKNSGKGSTIAQGNFSARMSAIVKEVLPNGTLLIEGTRTITTNKDTQTIIISGIVRREDIRPDNSVLSLSIADASIKTTGKGMIADRQRRGILTRLLDWIF
jgi:flagellar L-ring protein precursor FlgH